MNNANMPAMPIIIKTDENVVQQAIASGSTISRETNHKGLTKREYAAIKAMQGLLMDANRPHVDCINFNYVAIHAVKQADALLKELEK